MLLRDFRGVDEAEVAFAPSGVTIVHGPNEVGKSSIAEALDVLIRHPDSSRRDDIRAVKPVHRDAGPFVEADIQCGPFRFTYSKRWLRQPCTELTIRAPAARQATGREAHDAVMAMLREHADLDLFRALWLRQGGSLDVLAPGARGSLGAALDAAASAGSAAGDDADVLIAAIEGERAQWYTETGLEKAVLTSLRARVETAEEAHERAAGALAGLAGCVDDLGRLRRELSALDAVEPARRKAVTDLEEAVGHARAASAAAREARLLSDAQAARSGQAQSALAARREAIARIGHDATQAAAVRDEAERARAHGAGDLQRRDAAQTALDAAAAALASAQDAFEQTDRDDLYLRDVLDRDQLGERLGRVRAADRLIADGESFLAGCVVDDALMRRIDAAAEERAVERGRREAAAVPVRVVAEATVQMEFDGSTWHLDPGDETAVAAPAGSEIRLPGIARVLVGPPVAHPDDPAVPDDAEQVLMALLGQAGVADEADGVGAARALLRRRGEEETRLRAARATRAVDLRDLTPDEMDDKIARADERIALYVATRGDSPAIPGERDTAKAVRAAAEERLGRAREGADRARESLDVAKAAMLDAERDAAGRTERLAVIDERIAAAGADLEAVRAGSPDDVLESEALRAAVEDLEADVTAARAEADAAGTDVDSLAERLANAADAVRRLTEDRGQARIAIARLEAAIDRDGDLGLADRVGEASNAVSDARHDLAVGQRRADTARYLHEVMTRHRDEAHRAYVAPYRAEVERLARGVFPPGTSVEVAHEDLAIITRTSDGRTVPLRDLSGGAREQLGVIGRLAAACIAAGPTGEAQGVPVIIDDALGFTDASRLEGMGAALAAAGERTQVIVLTCAPERYAAVGTAATVRMDPRG